MNVTHFKTPAGFRAWLKKNHTTKTELTVGFYRKDSGLGGMTYPEALDEALCIGWIDAVRHKIDDVSFSIRFTPRRPGSIWSLINVRHVERLIAEKRMLRAGVKVFEARTAAKTGIYSFEQKNHAFESDQEKFFRRNKKAWTFWEAQPPGYKRIAMHWVTSAKQAATRERRLVQLIKDSENGMRLGIVTGKRMS